jgi:hypothetical protein
MPWRIARSYRTDSKVAQLVSAEFLTEFREEIPLLLQLRTAMTGALQQS